MEYIVLYFENYDIELKSLFVWKLWEFPQGSNFVNFQQFFHHNFWLKIKYCILMVSSERSSSDLSEYTQFQIQKYFYIYKDQLIFSWKKKNIRFFLAVFKEILPNFSDFINSDDCIERKKNHKNLSDYNQFSFKSIF